MVPNRTSLKSSSVGKLSLLAIPRSMPAQDDLCKFNGHSRSSPGGVQSWTGAKASPTAGQAAPGQSQEPCKPRRQRQPQPLAPVRSSFVTNLSTTAIYLSKHALPMYRNGAYTGLAITNPLVLYRALLAQRRILPDPAQLRLGAVRH